MTTFQIRNILIKALKHYGIQNQLIKAMEESAELIKAIADKHTHEGTDEDIITEIADVRIMMMQLSYFFGEDKVEKEIARKVERLKNRIENDEQEEQQNKI